MKTYNTYAEAKAEAKEKGIDPAFIITTDEHWIGLKSLAGTFRIVSGLTLMDEEGCEPRIYEKAWKFCKPKDYEENQTIEVPEWNGEGYPPVGVECEYFHEPRKLWVKFIPLLITNKETSPNGISAIYGEWYHPNDCIWEPDFVELMDNPKFRPLETPEAKKEREELEAAYELYKLWFDAVGFDIESFEVFLKNKNYLKGWIALARKNKLQG